MKITFELEIHCTPEEEVIARALHAYTSYPGRHPSEIYWPPRNRVSLTNALNKARAIWAALKEYEQTKALKDVLPPVDTKPQETKE
jgi:hypothetical protein